MKAPMRYARGLILGAALVFGGATTVKAQEADAEFRNGVAAFEAGEFEKAEGHFRNVLKSKPSSDQALRYRDEAGYHFWVRALARGGRLAVVAQRILSAAEEASIRERQDLDKLREEMNGLWSDDFMTYIETTEKLVAVYGHYVVPELVAILSDKREDDKRVKAISLLARLGDEGTLAVIEMLESEDTTLQQNAAVCLGHMRDIRAIPPLKRLAEKATDPHVREAAETAVQRLGGPSYGTAEFYARIAEEFYRENPLFMVNRYREHVVWKWQTDRVGRRDVPKYRWNEEVAEEFCYDGLSVDANNGPLWTLLLNVYAQEWAEVEDTVRAATQVKDAGGEFSDEEMTKLTEQQTQLAKVKRLVASRGPEAILAALGKALADQRSPNAVFLIERLAELNMEPELLAGGGAVAYLPLEEQAGGKAQPKPTPAPTPRPTPPPANNNGGNGGGNQPKPKPVEDTPKPDEPKPDEPKPDEPATPDDGGSSPPPKRRPRRVSQGPAAPQDELTKLAYRGPALQGRVLSSPLGAVGSTREHLSGGAAMNAALSFGDKRVRYAAAIALAKLNPREYQNAGQVMTNLIDALGESGQRTVLVVERERDKRNRLVGLLRELGYMTYGVESGRDALARAKTFPSQDLIFVSSELNANRDQTVDGEGSEPLEFQFIDDLKADYRTAHVKVMVLAPTDRHEDMKSLIDDQRAIDVVDPDSIDKASLADKIGKAFAGEAEKRDEKSRSDKIAERAALAIASLKRGHTPFDITQAATALVENVKRDAGRPDSVRIACLQAIEAVGGAARGGLDVLAKEFTDTTNSVEVRRALAAAMGEASKGQALSPEAFEALKAGMAEEDEGVSTAAGYSLGKAQLTPQQAVEVFNAQRVE